MNRTVKCWSRFLVVVRLLGPHARVTRMLLFAVQAQPKPTDAGVGADQVASIQTTVIVQDSGVGTELPSVRAFIPVTDSGVRTEQVTPQVTLMIFDAGDLSSEAASTEMLVIVEDSGLGVERAWLTISHVQIDSTLLDHADIIEIIEPSVVSTKPQADGLPPRAWRGKRGRELTIKGRVDTLAELETLKGYNDGETHILLLPTGDTILVLITQVQPDYNVYSPDQCSYIIVAKESVD